MHTAPGRHHGQGLGWVKIGRRTANGPLQAVSGLARLPSELVPQCTPL
jgi:hypothetical protein